MASRSDQLHSQQFMRRRVVAALATRDPDGSPARRIGGALAASLLVAAVAVGAAGVYGLLRPGSAGAWRDGTAVIIEQETGARFVYRDGVLHPVLNYASALLILGTASPPRSSVSRAALAGVPRGVALGIPGAPDLLPTRDDLTGDAWSVCSRGGSESVVFVGPGPAGSGLGERGLLAADPNGGLQLLWHGRRYAITRPDLVLAAFAWPRQAAITVAAGLLNAVPSGPELGRVTAERTGRPSPVDGLLVGQVFVVENASGGRQYGIAQSTGLADLTPAQADLLVADGANGPGGRAHPLSQARYASAPRAASLAPTGDAAPPPTAPELARPGSHGGVCATVADGGTPQVALTDGPPRGARELAVGAGSFVVIPPGRGALVRSTTAPDAPDGVLGLVTDLGVRYPVPSTDALGMLGYAGVAPVRRPAAVVGLLPTGPALDPAAAARPARFVGSYPQVR